MDRSEALDSIGHRLLEALQDNARLSFAELGRRVGLSAPAVAERVRRFEDLGIVTGYAAVVDRARLGYGLTAFIRLRTSSDRYGRIAELASSMPEILECHHVTGEDGFVMKVVARSVPHLDAMIVKLAPFATTTSSVVLSTQVEAKPIRPPGRQGQDLA